MHSHSLKRGSPRPVSHSGTPVCVVTAALILWLALTQLTVAGGQHLGPVNSWRLSTDDTEIVISAKGGWPVLEALTSSKRRSNWLSSPVRESLMKSVIVNGVSKDLDTKFERADLDSKGQELTLHY